VPRDAAALLDILTRPGFSTRESADTTSGRGLGLDIVRHTMEALGGSLELDNRPGHGTTWRMRAPLTIAIVDAQRPYVTLDDVFADLVEPALLLVLDGVTDPHNLGACLRNADAFGAQAVVVPKDRAVGLNATVAKAASGAAETVPLIAVTNLARALADLKTRGVWVFGADQRGDSLHDADLDGPIAWVLGAEGQGLRRLTRDTCDRLIAIPLSGAVESLNVSVAAGICLYATRAVRARAIAAGNAVG
jgi:23S rRNA (guanosine2251-2'-O)-methyltransferase